MSLATFDFPAFAAAFDGERVSREFGWYDLADVVWAQSATLNAQRPQDHPMCGGAMGRLPARGETSCQYALFLLRWLARPSSDFIHAADW